MLQILDVRGRRMRDTARSKTARSEHRWARLSREDRLPDPDRILTVAEIHDTIADLVARFGCPPVRVEIDVASRSDAIAWYFAGTIYLPRYKRAEWNPRRLQIILHEFAHHLAPRGRSHGGQYTEAMLRVVAYALGDDSAGRLRGCYARENMAIGAAAEAKRKVAANRAAERLAAQYGETGTVFVVEVTTPAVRDIPARTAYVTMRGGHAWLSGPWSARAWRSRKHADKERVRWNADPWGVGRSARVVEMDGRHDGTKWRVAT